VLRQIEGSRAVAETVALCRPEVVCAYPISPQTHIIEAIGASVKAGTLSPCEFINVESEFAAMSVSIGASAAGARAYTATASQGLLFMIEAVYNAAGLGLPIVMTLANRAIGAPINIWNDHSDAMAVRDSGWIQLFAETNQEAADLHVQAFRLAEELSVPVMVCMDGFILTHAVERVDVPEQGEVDAFLPPYQPRQVLDPGDPVSIGAMVGPEAFEEVRYLAHLRQLDALERIPALSEDQLDALERIPALSEAFAEAFGRHSGGLVRSYRTEDAETVVVALGSVLGTIKDAVDARRDAGQRVGVVGITSFRPFPLQAVRDALSGARRVVVVEKAFSIGFGGVLSTDVAMATHDAGGSLRTVVAGLGGRPITRRSLEELLVAAGRDQLDHLTFLDLDHGIVDRERARMTARRRSGPSAENVLRDIGTVASRIG
jgi:pyruvate ferredoxin oxidoreductase alpha subunit